MKTKFILLILFCYFNVVTYAQVGINTNDPKTTLDIVGKSTDINVADGIIIPKVTKSDLAKKSTTTYTATQNGTLIFVTDITTPSGTTPSLAQVININSLGFYYFDENNIWQKLIVSANADISKDAWEDNPTNTRVELVKTSTGATRTSGNEAVITDAGNLGLGTTNPSNKLHVLSTANPVKFEGLTTDATAPNLVVVGTDGILKTVPKTAITTTSVSNTSTNNTLTTTVNGTTGLPVNIVNSNTLTKPLTNTIRSTVNNVTSTPDVQIVNDVINTVTGNNLSTTVNGVSGTNVTVPNIYTSNGTLTSNRTVTQAANTLAFTGSSNNAFSVDGTTFSVDAANDNVGLGTSSPNTNAKLEINATNKGFLLPRVALTATGNSSPLTAHVAGMEVYNTATNSTVAGQEVFPGKYYNDGSKWNRELTTQDTKIIVGANAADFIPTPVSSIATTTTDGTADLSTIYTFTLDKPSYVEFKGNISVALDDSFGNPIVDGRTRLSIIYWTFTALPTAAITAGYVIGGQYARATNNYSAYFTGSTVSTTQINGNFFLHPSATYLLPIGTYSVKLTSITAQMGVQFRTIWGQAGYDTASIIIKSAQ